MNEKKIKNDLFLRACRSEKVSRVPVWMMRQAGRFMPEYWQIKNKYDFLTMCGTPAIAAEVTMLPVHLLHTDAAILFSDILVTAKAMGSDLSFEQGFGPKIANPIASKADVDRLPTNIHDRLDYVGKAIEVVQDQLNQAIPLIGFAGAPFTVMSYMVEGQSTRDFKKTKLFIHNHPALAHALLEKITTVTIEYLNMQVQAGVDALQIFDSWAGALSWDDYKNFSHRYLQQIFLAVNRTVPIISFAKNSGSFYPLMIETKPDVISLDWNASLPIVKNNLPSNIAIQGNLDPHVLYADQAVIAQKIDELLVSMTDQNGFIFNLGHGLMPDIPFENVKFAFDYLLNK